MIFILEKISELKNKLDKLVQKKIILDYRMSLKVSNKLGILIQSPDPDIDLEKHFDVSKVKHLEVEILSPDEVEFDPFYKEVFNSKNKVNFEARRRLSSLLEKAEKKRKNKCPIITFYSYKGGMGRSTTLALCAAHFAWHHSYKVVVIDCDLEAPGFTNYFLEEPDAIINHNGFVEYLLDKETSKEDLLFTNYSWEVSKEYSNSGEIHIMPAGNLDDKYSDGDLLGSSRRHYLEGLARIDISSKSRILGHFEELLKDINKNVEPDLILIDSRTGFNDIFGLAAFNLSNLVIGFFGNNAQSMPGLYFFIDTVNKAKNGVNAILINSILSRRKPFTYFQQSVDDYILAITKDNQSPIVIDKFPIMRESFLEYIGTKDEEKEEFIDLVKNKRSLDYENVFKHIHEILFHETTILPKNQINSDEEVSTATELAAANTPLDKALKSSTPTKTNMLELKSHILKKMVEEWPSLYGENFDFDKEYEKNRIFYRKSMEDIFNPSKLLILGNKGTGKTYLYEALKNKKVVQKLQQRANKTSQKYEFFHIIDKEKDKFIDTNKFDNIKEGRTDLHYERFWILYTWNAIMLESRDRLNYNSKLNVFPIKNDTETKIRFQSIISNDSKFKEIEKDLNELDQHLKSSKNKKNLIVIFDGLDSVVKPNMWSERIAPLVKFWRFHNFSKISPKLFLRSDLFEKMSNITNVKELRNQAITIEWDQKELFAYFFKFVFSAAPDAFYKYLEFSKEIPPPLIKQIRQKSGEDNQIPLEEHYLKPLVTVFFGKYASMDNTARYGISYDWFYRNLKNANETISLRPFIDLIETAITYSIGKDKKSFPILPATYYAHGQARKTAVKNHFDDLASETGNADLEIIFSYIRERKSSAKVYQSMYKTEMDAFLTEIIKKDLDQLENKSIDSLIYLLKVNGIIEERFSNRGLSYFFALLYKYYLGLKTKGSSNPKIRRRYKR